MKKLLVITFILFIASLAQASDCPDPEVTKGSAPWLKVDQGLIPEMHKGCKGRYGKDACASKVMKVEDGVYRVLCAPNSVQERI